MHILVKLVLDDIFGNIFDQILMVENTVIDKNLSPCIAALSPDSCQAVETILNTTLAQTVFSIEGKYVLVAQEPAVKNIFIVFPYKILRILMTCDIIYSTSKLLYH